MAAVADPATGVAVYDTYGESGWLEVGGTSAYSPIIASVYALAGTPAAGSNTASYPYSHTANLFDVTSGSDGSCSPAYLCTAQAGYDGPTGLGTPNGTAAFTNGSTTGLISGTPTTAATSSVTVTAKDTTNASGSATFTWTISTAGGGCTASQLLGNPGFETGSAAPWTSTAGVINPNGAGETAHSGTWYAWLDGYGTTHTDTLTQTVTVPAACTNSTLSFWLHIDTAETTTTTQFDKLTITVNGTTVATFSNLNHASGYQQHTYSLGGRTGSVTIKFSGTEDSSLQTSFVVDDTAVNTG